MDIGLYILNAILWLRTGSDFGLGSYQKQATIFFPQWTAVKFFTILLEKLWENMGNITKPGPYWAIYNFPTHLWSANENLRLIFEKYAVFSNQKSKIDSFHQLSS